MKPLIIFTNFWDANIIIQDKYVSFCSLESNIKEKYYAIWLNNFQVYSIALGIPDSSKIPFLKNIFRLNHFCPTYDLLMAYKQNRDWEIYKNAYRKILISRKDDIDHWINNLEQDKIYILCCWEDTSKNCNCHRKILFDAMRSTKIWKDKAIWIYRHGNGKYFRINSHNISKELIDQNGSVVETKIMIDSLVSINNENEVNNLPSIGGLFTLATPSAEFSISSDASFTYSNVKSITDS